MHHLHKYDIGLYDKYALLLDQRHQVDITDNGFLHLLIFKMTIQNSRIYSIIYHINLFENEIFFHLPFIADINSS